MKTKILIVEDDPHILLGLEEVLKSDGFEVAVCNRGDQAMEAISKQRPALIVLDVMLPGKSGYDICKQLRGKKVATPILMLTAKGQELDKVVGLDLGADDYVTKPFGIDELLARVRAALRRGSGEPETASFDAGDFRVDLDSRRVHAHGQEIRLTPKEFDLFVYFARHPNRVITHRTLLEAVWGEASQEQPEYLRVFMGQLRKKLEPDPSNPRYLVTEPWVGYRFNPNG